MICILSRVKNFAKNPENLIYLAFISVFLHFVITGIVIAFVSVAALAQSKTRKQIFSFKGKKVFIAFTFYSFFLALFSENFLGAAFSIGFFLILAISYFVRANITEKTFENCLDICCLAAIPLALSAVVEQLLNNSIEGYNCKLWFFNENYFCSVLAAIVIICAHKATSHKSVVVKYYVCALFAALGLYLGQSMFAIVEVFIGICILLILKKKHALLAVLVLVSAIGVFIVLAIPDIFPRLSEVNITSQRRIRIWNEAMPFIGDSPLFGKGFLSYYFYARQNPSMYQTAHTHNFAIEAMLSLGIVGTVILLMLIWSYYQKAMECKELLRSNTATTLILTLSTAVLVHTMTDLTLLWLQTGLLYALILGAIGIDERALNKRIYACATLGGASDRKEEED